MKISAIGVTTFGNKSQVMKKAATGFMAATGAGLAADTFVKGLSKPDKAKENEILKERFILQKPLPLHSSRIQLIS